MGKRSDLSNIIKLSIIILTIVVGIIFILDLFNLPSLYGSKSMNINSELIVGLLNIYVVLLISGITYLIIDQRSIEKDNNKIDIARFLIKKSYEDCINVINSLTKNNVEKYMVPKINFDRNITENPIIINLHNQPFSNEKLIIELILEGQLSQEELSEYFEIKERYKNYITARLIFYDHPAEDLSIKNELVKKLKKEIKILEEG